MLAVSLEDFEEYVHANGLLFNSAPAPQKMSTREMFTLASGSRVQSHESWAAMYPMAQYLRLFRGSVTRKNIAVCYIHFVKWVREDMYFSSYHSVKKMPTKMQFYEYVEETGFGEDERSEIAPAQAPPSEMASAAINVHETA